MEEILLEKYGPFMDLEELASLLRIKKQSVYQQIYRGQLDIPHIRRGKKYLFPTQEVAGYFSAQLSRPVWGSRTETTLRKYGDQTPTALPQS